MIALVHTPGTSVCGLDRDPITVFVTTFALHPKQRDAAELSRFDLSARHNRMY